MAKSQFFRANIGVVVVNSDGSVLALERKRIPGAWQMPQGGLDEGEEPRDCALRELYGETRLGESDVEFVAEHDEWLAYELPEEHRSAKHGRGQVQKWFLYRFGGSDEQIKYWDAEPPEFADMKWVTLKELSEEVVEFRRGIYKKLALDFAIHLSG